MRRFLALALLAAATCFSTNLTGVADTDSGAIGGFFKPGVVFQDRNGDGAVDFVNAQVALPPAPTDAEISAASDVAARLGFETSAMNLPLADAPAPRPTVFIGAGSLAPTDRSSADAAVSAMKAGEGSVRVVRSGPQPAVVLLGRDPEGLRAAATWFSGHAPLAWDQKGPAVDQIAADARQFLASHSIDTDAVTVSAVDVVFMSPTVERITIDASLARSGDASKAHAELRRLASAQDASRPLMYPHVDSVRLRISAAGVKPVVVDLPHVGVEPFLKSIAPGKRPAGSNKENFDLSSFYGIDGALGDSDNNLIPDRVDVMLSPSGEGTKRTMDLAARLGLESTGVSIPVAQPPDEIEAPDSEPILVLIGRTHPAVDQLIKNGKWQRPPLAPGEGLIQVVRKAFGEKSAVIVTGGDAKGVDRAVEELAERFPHIWARGKDRTTLDDIEDDARKFLSGRTPAGQAAMSLYKLGKLADQLADKTIASAHVTVFVEKPAAGFADVITRDAQAKIHAASVDVDVEDMDVQHARTLVNDEFDVPSEVDEFWARFKADVLPAVKRGAPVLIEARLSEPPAVRRQIEQDARAAVVKAGADDQKTTVTVLSAYKQGYSWLYDVVRPKLASQPLDRIRIRFAELGPPADWSQEGMFAPTRWLLELYPIDEVLARELKIDLSKIAFEKAPIGSPAYEVIATSADGSELLRQTFEPAVVERPFFDRFPDYERVRVTTGWLKAVVGGRVAADSRIETDPERFWDHFQARTLPFLYDHTMALGEGKPRAEDAPFFGELRVDLSLSEPDYRIGVDEEQISSMEAIHEEIYFNTLHFFDVMGRFTRGAPLSYPGRIIPVMHPKADGKAGHAAIKLTGFAAARPSVVVDYVERDGTKHRVHLDVPKIAVERPQALAARVASGRDGLSRLDLRVKVDTDRDERQELVKRAAEERVDRTIISGEQVAAVLKNLERMREAGLYQDALAYHDLSAIQITAASDYESRPGTELVTSIANGAVPDPWPDVKKYLPAAGGDKSGPLVQWDTPIPPAEAYGILARMSSFKEASVYKVGDTYLGKESWAMDVMPPVEATHWSQAKQTTLKPTVVYSARQHANEVSSTSHTLKLAELLLTEPAYREKLKKVNVVFHPMTNPDGAQLAYDLQKITPDFMLHAGYLGALGVDVVSAQWDPDPMYPESSIRPQIWRTWLPDIFLNPHGYPTHEWVQLFSEYAAWVRTRAVETRDYWTMRGWWMPGFGWLDDPRYPRHKDAQMKLLQMITEYAKAAPATVALNARAYARYKRYSFDFDDKNFKLDFTNGVLIYKSLKGAHADPRSPDFMTRQPNVTIWDGSTEAPDETARGDWLQMVATAGLQWDKAILDYLVEQPYEIERKVDPFWGGVSLSINRPRPPKPPKADANKTSSSHAR